MPEIIEYEKFRDSVIIQNKTTQADSINIFDKEDPFIPEEDSIKNLLQTIDSFNRQEISFMLRADSLFRHLKLSDSFPEEERRNLLENSRVIDSFLNSRPEASEGKCREKGCFIYVDIRKSRQKLYLYLENELKDSFAVSTGIKRYRTPDMNTRPSGPLLRKYTSKKWPGGNYKGLGNMPYAIFVRGGYAIHGTTPGNFKNLGHVASHGCIRLHPDNARVLFELVKIAGLKNTWVSVRD